MADSVNLSETAIDGAKSEIGKAYGDSFIQVRHFKTKQENAQEAHEAIRPTNFAAHKISAKSDEARLYDLIWKRAIASQMADAQLERTIVQVSITPKATLNTVDQLVFKDRFVATGEVIKFEGFLKVYIESTDTEDDEDAEGLLPSVTIDENLGLNSIESTEKFSKPAPRYTEASLVKKLEELGIGRPSTYAPTITTITTRGYVEKSGRDAKQRIIRQSKLKNNQITTTTLSENFGAESNKLFPTDIGIIVTDFLVQHFNNVVDFNFTAAVEKEFDDISNGKMEWHKMIANFYKPFIDQVEKTEGVDRSEVGSNRILGTHPESGKTILVRLGKFGPIAQVGESDPDSEEKPQFASLQAGMRLDTITLEQALELFKLPREVGQLNGKTISAAIGRFGPYLRHDGKFVSLKVDDPISITEDRAIELILQKEQDEIEKLIKSFPNDPELTILKGRYGPYIKLGKKNVTIPKDIEPESLSAEKCYEMVDAAPETKSRFGAKKATAGVKSSVSSTAKTPIIKKTVAKKPAIKKATTTTKSSAKKTK